MAKVRGSFSNSENLREPEIKAALIDALYAEGLIYDDTVVVSEMPVAHMSRRADIVVANGHLLGFEIKSDGDKTSRLLGQIEAYQRTFEGIVIVTGAKHLEECLGTAASTVGVVAIDQMEDNAPKARMVRKPHFRKMGAETAIRQMRADDLYILTRSLDLNPSGARDRYTLEGLARNVPPAELRRAALGAIKRRYRHQFENFQTAKKQQGSTVEALRFLKRPAWNSGRSTAVAVDPAPSLADNSGELASLVLNVRPRRAA